MNDETGFLAAVLRELAASTAVILAAFATNRSAAATTLSRMHGAMAGTRLPIAEKVSADLFEIETVDAYPADYTECTEVAAAEKRAGVRPELAADVDTDLYDVIYLCYPNWWGTCPIAVLALLEGHDLSGKIVRPLCTNEGSGMGSSERDIRAAAPGATVGEGLAVAGGAVVRSRDVIQRWAEE